MSLSKNNFNISIIIPLLAIIFKYLILIILKFGINNLINILTKNTVNTTVINKIESILFFQFFTIVDTFGSIPNRRRISSIKCEPKIRTEIVLKKIFHHAWDNLTQQRA